MLFFIKKVEKSFEMEIQKTIEQIMLQIDRFENGPAAEAMQNAGMNYEQNFGVSLFQLKSIAGKFKKNRQLADLLRKKKIRETLLLAFLLEEIDKVTPEKADQLAAGNLNTEMVEQSVIHVLSKLNFAFEKAVRWCQQDSNFIADTGFILLARLFLLNNQAIKNYFAPLAQAVIDINGGENLHTAKAIGRCLRTAGLKNESYKPKILELLNTLNQQDAKYIARIKDEVIPYFVDY